MAMLAERRFRKRYNLVPRGKPLYEDDARFGTKMLERMGWSKGKGLGANEDGNRDFVRLQYKNDIQGLGFEDRDDHWTQHEQSFSALLDNLNGKADADCPEHVSDDESKPRIGFGFAEEKPNNNNNKLKEKFSGQSLEEKSKRSRARVHYKKFTRGKDLSQYSEKDLANIFGRKENETPDFEQMATGGAVEEAEKECQEETSNFAGVTTISTGLSLADYFKQKMDALKNRKNRADDNEVEPNNKRTLEGNENDEGAVEVPKKKKKKSSDEEADNGTAEEAIASPKKDKKKKLKDMADTIDEEVPKNKKKKKQCTEPSNQDEEIVEKPKKKKAKSKEAAADESVAVDEEDVGPVEKPKKKKKKSKEEVTAEIAIPVERVQSDSEEKPKKHKKKCKEESNKLVDDEEEKPKKKDKKRKEAEEEHSVPVEKPKKKKDKKCKDDKLESVENNTEPQQTDIICIDAEEKSKKKKKNKESNMEDQSICEANIVDEPTKTKRKKLKQEKHDTNTANTAEEHPVQVKIDIAADVNPTTFDVSANDEIENDLDALVERQKSHNVYEISTFCAEMFRFTDIERFAGSNMSDIVGYTLHDQMELKVLEKKNDEERVTKLWDAAMNKYNTADTKTTYHKYVKEVQWARQHGQKPKSRLNVKTFARKQAFLGI